MTSQVLTPRWTPLRPHPVQAELWKSPHRFNVVPAGRRSGKCLAAGQRVAMSDGTWKEVEAVRAGDYVLSMLDDYSIEPRRVSHVHTNGTRRVVALRTTGREVLCTENHPFLVDNQWTEVGDVAPGQLVAVPRALPVFGTDELTADEIDFLAIWLAEGKQCTISNGTSEIVDIVYRVARNWDVTIKHYAGVDIYLGKKTGSKDPHPVRKFLTRFGLYDCDSKTKFIPPEIFRLSRKSLARFLNLFFACDGYICPSDGKNRKRWSVGMGLANPVMLSQIAQLLLKFGIRGRFRHKTHKALNRFGAPYESWDFVFNDSRYLEIFCTEIGALAKEDRCEEALSSARKSAGSCNAYLPIGIEEIIPFLTYAPTSERRAGRRSSNAVLKDAPSELLALLTSWRKQSPHRCSVRRWEQIRPWTRGEYDNLANGGVAWEEVLAVTPVGKAETYDLTVEDSHNFIVEGLVTHNTETRKRKLVKCAMRGTSFDGARFFAAAPTIAQAKRIYWNDLKLLVPDWMKAGKPSETELVIKLINDSEIHVMGMDKPERIEGSPWDGGVLDEYGNIKEGAWGENIRPALADRRGWCDIIGVPEGRNHYSEMYDRAKADMVLRGAASEWGAYTWFSSTVLDPEEIEAARRDLPPKVFRQEYEAEFVDFSGEAFFDFEKFLVDGKPVEEPTFLDCVFAVVDCAVKDGKAHDGTGVVFFGKSEHVGHKLTILDWDLVQVEGSLLEEWIPSVFERVEALARKIRCRTGAAGTYVEDAQTGSVLIGKGRRMGWPTIGIPNELTAKGKDGRAFSASGPVHRGEVKITKEAYDKVVYFKDKQKNHLVDQVANFVVGDPDAHKRADDLLDCVTYGVILALGGPGGE